MIGGFQGAGWDSSCGGGPEIDVPDVYGALRGLRVWHVDEDGWLHGVTYPERWTPGTNEARCLAFKKVGGPGSHYIVPTASVYTTQPYTIDKDGKLRPKEGFETGVDCPGVARGNHGCGYFAKHGAANRYVGYTGTVTGVVEMFGQVELGPSGLRASKARIVALTRPKTLLGVAQSAAVIRDQAVYMLDHFPRMPLWFWPFLVIPKVRQAWQRRTRQIRRAQQAIRDATSIIDMYNQRLDLYRHPVHPLYDVPVYQTVDEMLKAFPVPDLTYLVNADQEAPEDT